MKEWFGDTKGVVRSRKSKDRQCNDQKNKMRNNDLQNTTQKPMKTKCVILIFFQIVSYLILIFT